MNLIEAVSQGVNTVEARTVKGGTLLTLSHSITSDNTVTVFVPDGNFVAWIDHEFDDASLSQAIEAMVKS